MCFSEFDVVRGGQNPILFPSNQWSVDENRDIGIILKATSFAFHRFRELRKEKKKNSFISHEFL